MSVTTAKYGTFNTHSGTLIEVAGAVNGKTLDHLTWLYDAGASVFVCIERI